MRPGTRVSYLQRACTLLLLCSYAIQLSSSLDNGQALLPPMGWLSWERFRCNIDCKQSPEGCISEHLIRDMVDRLVEDDFVKVGYNIVGIDDCWLATMRDASGRLQADSNRFPSGISALAEYTHKRGVSFGIYGDIGAKTCGGFPGMAGNLELDAQTFASWGVDYLKVDGCYAEPTDFAQTYPELGRHLNATGRPITYSCSWPAYLPDPVQSGFQVPYKALKASCNLWRNWVDIQDSWESLASILTFWAQESVHNKQFQAVAGPGSWNDPDMLIVGNKGLSSREEMEVQMGMWAILAAPLLMSNDLRSLPAHARGVLLDLDAIAINQDPLGHQGQLLACKEDCKTFQLWHRVLKGNQRALAFLNLSEKAVDDPPCITWQDIGWRNGSVAEVNIIFPKRVKVEPATGMYCVSGSMAAHSLHLARASLARREEAWLSKPVEES